MTSSNGNFPRYWQFVRGIHRPPVTSPHKGQWRRALMFSLICAWINSWANSREASDLRPNRTDYDTTAIMLYMFWNLCEQQRCCISERHYVHFERTISCATKDKNFVTITIYPFRWCCHFDEIAITGCTGSCQKDNIQCSHWWKFHQNDMMTSSNGNIFRVTGPLRGEFTGHRWIPRTKASDAELWCFLWLAPEWSIE